MQHDQLIGQVQARAKLSSRGDAERAVRATLRRTELLGGLGTADVRELATAGSTGEMR